ncbi:MAG: PilZ domain-containing protein [Acidobacteria bacterium]|nr:PilZ domain-containing protein [Acidobacteriota bacterium]
MSTRAQDHRHRTFKVRKMKVREMARISHNLKRFICIGGVALSVLFYIPYKFVMHLFDDAFSPAIRLVEDFGYVAASALIITLILVRVSEREIARIIQLDREQRKLKGVLYTVHFLNRRISNHVNDLRHQERRQEDVPEDGRLQQKIRELSSLSQQIDEAVRTVERRLHPRVPFLTEVDVWGLNQHFTARINDLSLGGCYIDSTTTFAVGCRIRARFKTSERGVVDTEAEVRYEQPSIGMGVKFEELTPEQEALILEVISNFHRVSSVGLKGA